MTDAEMLRQIVAALAEGRADIAFSGRLESHMDFPGNSETDKTQFIIAGLLLIGLAYWFGNWWLVAAALALVVAVYLAFWRGIVRRRIRRRFIAKAMADPIVWRKSWSFPGIALSAAGEECKSPAGDWRAFATRLKEQSAPPIRRSIELSLCCGMTQERDRRGAQGAPMSKAKYLSLICLKVPSARIWRSALLKASSSAVSSLRTAIPAPTPRMSGSVKAGPANS